MKKLAVSELDINRLISELKKYEQIVIKITKDSDDQLSMMVQRSPSYRSVTFDKEIS